MLVYTVWSLDVWGHHGSECCPGYGCRCMNVDMVDDTYSHDDNRCECSYTVNDRCRVGMVELDESLESAGVLAALEAGGYVHASLCEVDDVSDEYNVWINSAELGRPLLQLELNDEDMS